MDLCARALRTPIGGVRLTNSPPPDWTDLTDFPDGEIWKFHQQERNLVELSDWGFGLTISRCWDHLKSERGVDGPPEKLALAFLFLF